MILVMMTLVRHMFKRTLVKVKRTHIYIFTLKTQFTIEIEKIFDGLTNDFTDSVKYKGSSYILPRLSK